MRRSEGEDSRIRFTVGCPQRLALLSRLWMDWRAFDSTDLIFAFIPHRQCYRLLALQLQALGLIRSTSQIGNSGELFFCLFPVATLQTRNLVRTSQGASHLLSSCVHFIPIYSINLEELLSRPDNRSATSNNQHPYPCARQGIHAFAAHLGFWWKHDPP